jgi:nucleotide-binding universal stress UspA family protein
MDHTIAATTFEGPLAVVVDGSPTDKGGAEWAAHFAGAASTSVRLVHGAPKDEWSAAVAAELNTTDFPTRLRQEGEGVLARAVEVVHGVDPQVAVESEVSELSAARMAKALSADAAMLVVGACESGPLRDIVFGYSPTAIVNAATCPVLVWHERRDSGSEPAPVAVGVDGSEPSKRALSAAFELASILDAELLAVHVGAVHETDQLDYGTSVDWQHLREAERQWLQANVDAYRDKYPSVPVRAVSVGASAAHELRSISATSQVLVVGSRGRNRFTAAILGSVSQNLVHHAECPVLVVH